MVSIQSDPLRFVMPVLVHVLKHMLRHVPVRRVLEHVPGHMLEQVPKHVPDRHVLDRHVLARHVLGFKKSFQKYLLRLKLFSLF